MNDRKKLGLWSRLGIVITVSWLIGSIGWNGFGKVQSWRQAGEANYQMCTSGEAPELFVNTDCRVFLKRDAELERNIWFNSVEFALQWTIVGWIVFGVMFWIVRWVVAGRTKAEMVS